jgi:N4-gp56 family major capsid protein
MAIHALGTEAARIGKLKGEILKHAMPMEVLGITGSQKKIPKNKGDSVVFRRWLPYGAIASDPNNWDAVTAAGHVTTEGVTPSVDNLDAQDITAQLSQYHVLYGVTDRTVDMYEDDVPEEMKRQTGERMGLVREMVRYGAIQGITNKYYAGGTSRATVDEAISLGVLRKITRSLRRNHARFVTSILAPSPNIKTSPVEASFLVFCHTDVEQDIRDLTGFVHVSEYGSRKVVHEMEIGSCENFRFILSPELSPIEDAGGAATTNGLAYTTANTACDVYPVLVVGEDAWGQVALRGSDSIDVTWIPPGQKDKNDPLGQRGYVGCKTYFASVVLNNGWGAVAECGVKAL